MSEEITAELQQQAEDVLELMEDMVSFYCDEERVSGEKVWVMIQTLSKLKLADFPNYIDPYPETDYE
tara:strand:+ start:1482 stop:1682 length:201 start_codon:yes stop_codon:yes gene_type:complete